ncbi:hypothetical protein VRY85_10460 [Achromobacter sp. F4_2707]|uniref:hypothetical protein n=1 Tax=Achromobacter sp. F4_2707 TaxID=3114286 RepID=UPI0039C73212
MINEIGRIVKEISAIAHENLGRLGLADDSMLQLEQATVGLVDSVQRFNVRADERQRLDAGERFSLLT